MGAIKELSISQHLKFKASSGSLEDVRSSLNYFTIAMQDAITKRALRYMASDEIKRVKASRGARYAAASKHLRFRIKVFGSGIAWLGIGDRIAPGRSKAVGMGVGGRAKRRIYDEEGLGWRSHFHELGFHTYPPDQPHAGTGRGWKRGIRHRGRGVYHRGTRAMEIVHKAFAPNVIAYLRREIVFEMNKLTMGNRARRGNITRFMGVIEGAA